MSVGKKPVRKCLLQIACYKMLVRKCQISGSQMSFGKMSVDQMFVGHIILYQTTVNQMPVGTNVCQPNVS
jgi:hypothetical protein